MAALMLALTSLSSLPAVAQVVSSTITLPFGGVSATAANSANHMVYLLAAPFNASQRNPRPPYPPYPPYHGAQQGAVVILNGKSGAYTSLPGFNPTLLAVNASANKIYVANASYPALNGFPAVASSLTIINGVDNSYTSLAMSAPSAMAVDPVANKVYVSVADSKNDLVVVDGKTNTISATIPMPVLFTQIAFDTGLGKVYGIAYGGSSVISVNLATSAITTIPAGGLYTTLLVADSQTHRAYRVLQNYYGVPPTQGVLEVINTNTDRRIATRYLGNSPTAAAVNPNTKTVYILNTTDAAFPLDPNDPEFLGSSMSVLDEATLTLLRPHGVPILGSSQSYNLAIDPVANKIYIPFMEGGDGGAATLTVVDGNTHLPATVYAGPAPFNIVLDAGLNQAYLLTTTLGTNAPTIATNVTVLDLTGGSVAVPTIFPASLKFSSPVGHASRPRTVYLANTGGIAMDVTKLSDNLGVIRQTHDCPGVLDPGAVCPIQLRFRPSAANPTYVTDTFQAAISTGATAAISIIADVPPLAMTLVLSGSEYDNGLLYVSGRLTSPDPDLLANGLTVTATLNGITASSVVVDSQFSISFDPSSLVTGQAYPVTLNSAGNDFFLPSTVTGSITP